MFVLTNNVSAAMRVIATLLATAIVMWSIGYYATAEAANVTDLSDTLTDSAPGASSDHTISFTTPTGVAGTESITITFPGTFTGTSSIVAADIDFSVAGGAAETVADGAPGAGEWGLSWTGNTLTLLADAGASVAAAASSTIIIGGTGNNQLVNPASPQAGNESYEIDISAGTDTGHTRVVILDTVLVTATVDTIFDFTVYGNGSGEAVNGTSTDIITGSTTIPFGTLTAYALRTGSQDLTVQTNAINGFVVTVQSDGAFESSTGADIDDYKDGTDTVIPEPWESPLVGLDIADENTWGHWVLPQKMLQLLERMNLAQMSGLEYQQQQLLSSHTMVQQMR